MKVQSGSRVTVREKRIVFLYIITLTFQFREGN